MPIAVIDVARAGVAEDQRGGQLDVGRAGRRPAAAGRACARSASRAASCPRARRRPWCAAACATLAQLARRCRRCRVELGGDLQLDQRLLELPGRACSRRPRLKCSCDGAQLGALERQPGIAVVGLVARAPWCIRRPRGRSPAPLGLLARRAVARRRRAAGQRRAASDDAASATSRLVARAIGDDVHASGNAERELLIGYSLFSFRFVKTKVESPPWRSRWPAPGSAASPGRRWPR